MLVHMPFKIIKEGRGWKTQDVKSGKVFSAKPLTKEQAQKQRIAIALSEHRKTKKPVGSFMV